MTQYQTLISDGVGCGERNCSGPNGAPGVVWLSCECLLIRNSRCGLIVLWVLNNNNNNTSIFYALISHSMQLTSAFHSQYLITHKEIQVWFDCLVSSYTYKELQVWLIVLWVLTFIRNSRCGLIVLWVLTLIGTPGVVWLSCEYLLIRKSRYCLIV